MSSPTLARPEGQPREQGFTLIELVVAMPVVLTGIVALVLVLSRVTTQQRQAEVYLNVLSAAQGVVEDIQATTPENIIPTFDGQAFQISGVSTLDGDPAVALVIIDDSNPTLYDVAVAVDWAAEGRAESLVLRTAVFTGFR